MTDGLADYGSEQFAQFDLKKIGEALVNGKALDPREIYHIPPGGKSRYTRENFNWPTDVRDWVQDILDRTKYHSDKSEFFREAIVLRASYLASGALAKHPIVLQIEREREQAAEAIIDKLVKSTFSDLFNADGEQDRQRIRNRTVALIEYCKERGHVKRVASLEDDLKRDSLRADYLSISKRVDEIVDEPDDRC